MPQDTAFAVPNHSEMRVLRLPSFGRLGRLAMVVALAGCQGNLGSGSGLSLPGAPSYNQPGGPSGVTPQTRQRTLEGAVFLTPEMGTLPLPQLGGFAISLQLGTPPPTPTPTPSGYVAPSASPTASGPTLPRKARTKVRAVAAPAAAPSPSPAPVVSASVSASTSALPSASPGATVAPSASGSPSAGASSAPKSPSPSASPVPKTVTKLIVFPDDAPLAPTPAPSGNVQTYPVRKALVRGSLKPGADLALYGLGAVKFTIPTEEETAGRGFTVAVFAAGRHHHDTLVASDPKATLAENVVASGALDALVLKKNTTYLLVLYADELLATPGSVPAGYPAPGNNPFVTPLPGTSPGALYTGTPAVPTATPTFFH